MAWTREASDETLLAAYGDGDVTAFEALFRRYQEPLRRHLTRMLNDRDLAEDLVIETFQRLHVHRTESSLARFPLQAAPPLPRPAVGTPPTCPSRGAPRAAWARAP
jgi:hypothetical protein